MTVVRYEIEKLMVDVILACGKLKYRPFLDSRNAHKAIQEFFRLPESMTEEENDNLELIAYGTLVLKLSGNVLRHVI